MVQGKGVFMSLPYLKALEDASLPGLFFRYVILNRHKEPAAVLVFQFVELDNEGLGGVLHLEGYGGLPTFVSNKVNRIIFKRSDGNKSVFMVCGSLLSSGEYGIASNELSKFCWALSKYDKIKASLTKSLSGYKVVAEMVKDFYDQHDSVVQTNMKGLGFPLRTDPEMIVDLDSQWNDFDDYLHALSSKYRVRANAALKSAADLEVRQLSNGDMDVLASRMEYLFGLVRDKAPVRLVRPDIGYLQSMKKAFGDLFVVTGYFLEGQLIAFRTCLIDGPHAEAHYIGIDYSLNKKYGLYQNILYGLVSDAIRHKTKRLFLGRTALEIKSTVGAMPHRLSCYLRFSGRIMNTVVKTAVSGLGPKEWIPRSPFR